MAFLATTSASPDGFDPSQFKLQPNGSFKISIRAMAAMAGVNHAGIVRSLKSAGDESALPCAKSLVAQGFSPGDVSSWGETGGIPEAAAPFILEYYGIEAASPSQRARAVLLSFSRVGINAYLKEKLGQLPQSEPQKLLSTSFTADMEAARLIADMVAFGGKDKSISLAQSLTVIGKKHPQHAELCFESQRILCPEAKQWGSQAKVLERITAQLGEDKVIQLAAKCKEVGLISKKNPNWIVNKALCEMGLQYQNISHTLSQANYVATAEGQKYSREETRPASNQEEKWVPQLLWLVNETADLILEFLSTRLTRKA